MVVGNGIGCSLKFVLCGYNFPPRPCINPSCKQLDDRTFTGKISIIKRTKPDVKSERARQ